MQSTTDRVIHSFIASTVGQKIAAEVHTADVKQRQAKLDEIAAARADAANGNPAAQQRLDAAVRKEREAEATLQEAHDAVLKARAEVLSHSTRVKSIAGRIEAELRNGLPRESVEALRKFDGEMGERFEKTRDVSLLKIEDRDTGRFVLLENSNRSKAIIERFTNAAAIAKRLRAIQNARRVAREQLPLEPDVSPTAIAAKLDELRATIPNVDPMEFIGNNFVFGQGTPAPAASTKSTYDTRGITHVTMQPHAIGQ